MYINDAQYPPSQTNAKKINCVIKQTYIRLSIPSLSFVGICFKYFVEYNSIALREGGSVDLSVLCNVKLIVFPIEGFEV